jgi:hypothetical protein
MHPTHRAANPFAMLLDPQAVLAQVAHSERLSRLQSRICRPLDKPLLAGADASDELADVEDDPGQAADGAQTD